MDQQELATCHCIIPHPSKPKFLAVKHSDRWSPPIVMFPPEGGLVARLDVRRVICPGKVESAPAACQTPAQ